MELILEIIIIIFVEILFNVVLKSILKGIKYVGVLIMRIFARHPKVSQPVKERKYSPLPYLVGLVFITGLVFLVIKLII